MGKKFEKKVLKFLLSFGILALIVLLKKPPVKDWLIIFLVKSYFSSLVDNFLVKMGYISYPANLFKKYFNISVIFDYLIFPITCVFYNQLTLHSSIRGISAKVLLFSVPMTLVEDWLEKNTQLIKYHKGWNSKISFLSITFTFLFARLFIGFVRKISNHSVLEKGPR
ncbi:CBO0543 family protein [Metabacillus idriensis]|uniref:CBO0543 family protein n=1 Tax=Metabacillus idriensis TaxID=324768 RepID=UPI003D28288B